MCLAESIKGTVRSKLRVISVTHSKTQEKKTLVMDFTSARHKRAEGKKKTVLSPSLLGVVLVEDTRNGKKNPVPMFPVSR